MDNETFFFYHFSPKIHLNSIFKYLSNFTLFWFVSFFSDYVTAVAHTKRKKSIELNKKPTMIWQFLLLIQTISFYLSKMSVGISDPLVSFSSSLQLYWIKDRKSDDIDVGTTEKIKFLIFLLSVRQAKPGKQTSSFAIQLSSSHQIK